MSSTTRKRLGSLLALGVIPLAALAAAQSVTPDEMQARTVPYVPPPVVKLRTDVEEVEVPVVVRDGRHRAVAGLTRDNFEIYDTGKKQTITAFSVERFTSPVDVGGGTKPAAAAGAAGPKSESLPRFVALCFDDLNMDALALKPVKEAAQRFVKTGLAPGDRLAVVTAAQTEDSQFIADVPKLVEQIANVTSHQSVTGDEKHMCPRIRPYEAYLIANHLDKEVLQAKIAECEACWHNTCPPNVVAGMSETIWSRARANSANTLRVIEGLVGGMAKLPGQRMILLASSGFLTGNLEADLDRFMAKALHAEVVINTLDAKGLYTVIPGGDASSGSGRGAMQARNGPPPGLVEGKNSERAAQAQDDGMAVLASGTGGTFYHNNNDLALGFRQLGMVPEIMYVLSFSPSGVPADGRFHGVKVRFAAGKRYSSLQARLGYTAASPNAAEVSPPSKLDSEAMASDTITDLPVRFTWEQWAGAPNITMVAHLDVSRLHFETRQDRRAQRLTMVAVLLDARGGFVTGKRSELSLSFTEATFAQLAKTGFTASLTLKAPPGSYGVRAVVQDGLEGKVTAAGGSVQVK